MLRAFHDLIFPPRCLSCERRLDSSRPPLFCKRCLENIRPIVSPLCICCGDPFPAGRDHLCGNCLTSSPVFDSCRSLFYYQAPVTDLLVKLKFSGRIEILPSLAALAEESGLLSMLPEIDSIIPVPLHVHRLRKRGFNQAVLLARHLFPEKKRLLDVTSLIRTRATTPQSQLSGKARRKNLRGSFSLASDKAVRGKKLLLLDDVYTTGSTVKSCCQVLREGRPSEIHVLTVARSVSLTILP